MIANLPLLVEIFREKQNYLKQTTLSDRNFFLYLSEYITFLQKHPLFTYIQHQLTKDKEEDEKETKNLGHLLFLDIEKVRKDILSELHKKKVPLSHLNDIHFSQVHSNYDNANQHYVDFLEGRSSMSGDKIDNLYSIVGLMINGLDFHGHKDIIKQYAHFDTYKSGPELGKEYVSRWKISDHYDYYMRATGILKTKSLTKPWSCFEKLTLIPFALYEYPSYRDKLLEQFYKENKPVFMDIANVDGLVSEMKNIIEGRKDFIYEFKRVNYLYYAEVLSQYIIDFISLKLKVIEGIEIIKDPLVQSDSKTNQTPNIGVKRYDLPKKNEYQTKKFGDITINFTTNKIAYASHVGIDVTINSHPVKLLLLLIDHAETVVKYETIKSSLDLPGSISQTQGSSKFIKYIKQELKNILLSAKMPESVFEKMFKTSRGSGYMITKG